MNHSQASLTFAEAIKDAENLLAHFDKLNTKPPPPENEVLKRAGLVMAMTAWETYVEDRVIEAASARLSTVSDALLASFVKTRLKEEVNKLHNPSSEKTIQLFADYAGVDVSSHWNWSHVEPSVAKQRLNGYLKLRGDVVHRSRLVTKGPPQPHPVTREDLQKAVGFLKELVKGTERALAAPST
ncbi:MAG: hypothetical protein HYX47_12355 [Burkholderiales bacterium]|nr:hypothetical protein [Burkholderiales bacterium]